MGWHRAELRGEGDEVDPRVEERCELCHPKEEDGGEEDGKPDLHGKHIKGLEDQV